MNGWTFWRRLHRLLISVAWIWLLPITAFSPGLLARTEAVDVTGVWDMTVESQEGTAHPLMRLKQSGDRINGTYEGKIGGNLEGTIKGNEINFKLTLKFQDAPYTVTYSGTVTEESMKGTVRFGSTGTGSWSAIRRKNPA